MTTELTPVSFVSSDKQTPELFAASEFTDSLVARGHALIPVVFCGRIWAVLVLQNWTGIVVVVGQGWRGQLISARSAQKKMLDKTLVWKQQPSSPEGGGL